MCSGWLVVAIRKGVTQHKPKSGPPPWPFSCNKARLGEIGLLGACLESFVRQVMIRGENNVGDRITAKRPSCKIGRCSCEFPRYRKHVLG